MRGNTTQRTTVRVGPLLGGLCLGVSALPTLALGTLVGLLTGDPFLEVLGALLIMVALVQLLSRGFLVHADEQQITLVRPWSRHRYPWERVVGLVVVTRHDPESSAEQAVRLYLQHPRDSARMTLSPLLMKPIGPYELPSGKRLQLTAETFALFTARGLPVEQPEYVNRVLRAAGLPPNADEQCTIVRPKQPR
ncbi:hypothetical protein [Kitasatospora aureofaciens]|uniref:hypothetical protein n=1 Tax=Kitasatospora aureofaciens TaxID=1894 RepID=UPI001C44ED2F|nr:hypothetical protein [Kitasatospora aureofaciens]MBV6702615.1 hypothetical protein [Kitasatospora aureofaciens]